MRSSASDRPVSASSAPGASAALAARAYDHLAASDPILAALVGAHGRPDPTHWGWAADQPGASAFRVLLLQIVSQRLSISRSFRVFGQLEAAAGGIDPDRVLGLGAPVLSMVGLPAAKVAAALALAEAMLDGSIDLERLPADDDQALRQLTTLRGIGPWSAQMFLLGYAHRLDILPAGDFGIRRQIQLSWQLPALPSPAEVARRGRSWSPYRSYAAALLWSAHLDQDRRRADVRPGDRAWRGKATAAGPSATGSD
jgi:DNA-3-methyladenine glycosylase II